MRLAKSFWRKLDDMLLRIEHEKENMEYQNTKRIELLC